MKPSFLDYSISQFAFLGRPAAAAFALATLSACSTFKGSQRVGDSSLLIQTVDASGGVLSGPRAYETADRLFVTGSLSQILGQDIPAPAHVDVQLVAADGTVLAEARDDIDSSHPRLSRARRGRISFVVSFPLTEVGDAARIIVRYHPTFHPA